MFKNILNIKTASPQRAGVTLIEVLTSMVVAAIGVAGVLIMIPFAVQQSQRGITKDVADIVAQNAYEEFRIRGYDKVASSGDLPWFGATVPTDFDPPVPSAAVVPETYNALNPRVIHIDPHAVATILEETSSTNDGFPTAPSTPTNPQRNPDFLSKHLLNDLKIPVATLTRSATITGLGSQLSLAEARDLVQGKDDLEFGNTDFTGFAYEDSDLAGPQAYFNQSVGGNAVTRQFRGKYSWSAVMVPQRTGTARSRVATPSTLFPAPTLEYKMYILVYADRSFTETTAIPPDDVASDMLANDMLATKVERYEFNPQHEGVRDSSPNPNNLNGGYSPSVNRIVLGPDDSTNNVAKDDWVMLINKRLPPNYANPHPFERSLPLGLYHFPFRVEDTGYDLQITFCRVLSIDPGAGARHPSLSVQGGAFDFYYKRLESHPAINAGTPELSAVGYNSDTWVVHLKNVINVHERTLTLE